MPRMSVDRCSESGYCGAPFSAAQLSGKNRRSRRASHAPRRPYLIMIQMRDVMSKPMPDFREGSIVKGRILEVRPREVLVDIGYKSEGVISLSEFEDVENLEVGDEVDVLLERLENDEGMVILSKEKAVYRSRWHGGVASHHRHDLGPARTSERAGQSRSAARSGRARHQQGKRARLVRPEADPEKSVGPD